MQRGVEDLLHHQRLQLRAEEAAQLRQFRGRLAEVEAQLAADKRAAAADQDSWMSKTVSCSRTQQSAADQAERRLPSCRSRHLQQPSPASQPPTLTQLPSSAQPKQCDYFMCAIPPGVRHATTLGAHGIL